MCCSRPTKPRGRLCRYRKSASSYRLIGGKVRRPQACGECNGLADGEHTKQSVVLLYERDDFSRPEVRPAIDADLFEMKRNQYERKQPKTQDAPLPSALKYGDKVHRGRWTFPRRKAP